VTTELYLADSSRTSFEATVERVVDDRVVLDRTHFYPTGGGQPHDTGVLHADGTEWTVEDVRKQDTIYHVVDGDTPEEGTTVTGEIDAGRRRAHSRYHTAQHLLSAVLLDEFDAETTGNQLYADRARLDCEHERFSETDLGDVATRVNELIDAAHDVEWYTLDRETAETELDAERTRLHLLPDSITEVRIVDIGAGDVDRTACAGTHVENTSEIGEFSVTGRETAGSGQERIRFELE
jgi:misacylated tRNA(Ala) deacylase